MPSAPGVDSLMADGDHVRDVGVAEPAGLVRDLIEERKGGKPAADGEESCLEELPGQCGKQKDLTHFATSFPSFPRTIPKKPASRTSMAVGMEMGSCLLKSASRKMAR